MIKKLDLDWFLKRTNELGWVPNFYLSKPYLLVSNPQLEHWGNWVILLDNSFSLFPPVPVENEICPPESLFEDLLLKIWSDVEGWEPWRDKLSPVFLDWEYIFDSKNFKKMEGGHWETFRKNSRKWERRQPQKYPPVLIDSEVLPSYMEKEIQKLLAEWLEEKADSMEDSETMVEYLLSNPPGASIKYLMVKDRLYAILAWDYSRTYINFRYCITRPGERFLEEYVRLKFYLLPEVQQSNLLVNDGGSVGNEGLERFKDKMNPVKKRKVFSWIYKGGGKGNEN